MNKALPLAAVVVLMAVLTAWSSGSGVSGAWEASVMGSKIKVQARQEGGAIKGVAHVHSVLGAKDTYHFTGVVNKGKIRASHHSGHSFSGKLTSDGRLIGVLRTKGGKRVAVNAVRK
jgi:hypothetical protein